MRRRNLRKITSMVLSLALMGTLLSACGGGSNSGSGGGGGDAATTPAAGKEIVFGHVYSESHNINTTCIEFKEYIEANSDMTVVIMANSVLGGDEDMLEMCAEGTVTLMSPSVASLEMYASDWAIVSLPYLYNNADGMYAALDGELGDYLKDTLKDTEFISLGFNSNGIRNMSNNIRAINTVDDVKGLKMRVMNNATYVTWMNALGANATPMGFNEVFTGLQQGTVDGQENSASLTYESKFNEVQKYYSITEHVYDMNTLICNREFYEGLTAEEKEVFDYALQEFVIKHQRQMEADSNDEYIQLIADSGVEVNYVTDDAKDGFRDALAGVYADFRASLGDEIWSLVEKYQ